MFIHMQDIHICQFYLMLMQLFLQLYFSYYSNCLIIRYSNTSILHIYKKLTLIHFDINKTFLYIVYITNSIIANIAQNIKFPVKWNYIKVLIDFFHNNNKINKKSLTKNKKKPQEKSGILHKLPKFLFIYFLFFWSSQILLKISNSMLKGILFYR